MDERFLTEPDAQRSWALFLEQCLPTVDRAALRAAGDRELGAEIAAEVLAKLRSDWPALLARFSAARAVADASFRVWLAVVCRRLSIDVLRARHGRSATPRPIARLPEWKRRLWTLVCVEGRELSDAARTLANEQNWSGTLVELARAVSELEKLSPNHPRHADRPRFRSLDAAGSGSDAVAASRSVEPVSPSVHEPTRAVQRKATHAAFARTLSGFESQERALLRIYFFTDSTAAEVARIAGYRDASQVYETVRRLLVRLRSGAERQGLASSDLSDLGDFDWSAGLGSSSAHESDRSLP